MRSQVFRVKYSYTPDRDGTRPKISPQIAVSCACLSENVIVQISKLIEYHYHFFGGCLFYGLSHCLLVLTPSPAISFDLDMDLVVDMF